MKRTFFVSKHHHFCLFCSVETINEKNERRMLTSKRRQSGQSDKGPDSDDEHSLRTTAFAVDGVLPPEYGETRNGMDYLRRVRWEAQQMPPVSVAPAPPPEVSVAKKPTHPAVRLCTQSAARGDEWAAHTAGEERLRDWFRACRARWDAVREDERARRRRGDAERRWRVCAGTGSRWSCCARPARSRWGSSSTTSASTVRRTTVLTMGRRTVHGRATASA